MHQPSHVYPLPSNHWIYPTAEPLVLDSQLRAVVAYLIQHGADVDVADTEGKTSLYIACQRLGCAQLVTFMVVICGFTHNSYATMVSSQGTGFPVVRHMLLENNG